MNKDCGYMNKKKTDGRVAPEEKVNWDNRRLSGFSDASVSIPQNEPFALRDLPTYWLVPEAIVMRKARFTEHQIIIVLKSVEAGRTVKEICREAGISDASCYSRNNKGSEQEPEA